MKCPNNLPATFTRVRLVDRRILSPSFIWSVIRFLKKLIFNIWNKWAMKFINPPEENYWPYLSRKEAIEAINEILDQGRSWSCLLPIMIKTTSWHITGNSREIKMHGWNPVNGIFSKEVYPLDLETEMPILMRKQKYGINNSTVFTARCWISLIPPSAACSMDAFRHYHHAVPNPLPAQLVKIPLTGQPEQLPDPPSNILKTATQKITLIRVQSICHKYFFL